MNISRQIDVDLIFHDDRGQRLRDLCSWAVGLGGEIDLDSGMIINLVAIDHGLKLFKNKFSSSEISDIQVFFTSAKDFLDKTYAPFSAELTFLQLKTSWGQLKWEFPWKKENLILTHQHRIEVQSKSKQFEVYKVFTEHRGSSVPLFKRLKAQQLKRLWELQDSAQELNREMMEIKHLAAFGVQDFLGQHQRWFRLGF